MYKPERFIQEGLKAKKKRKNTKNTISDLMSLLISSERWLMNGSCLKFIPTSCAVTMRYQVPLFVAMQILLFPPIFRLVNPGTSAVQAPSVTQIFSSACLQEFESALLLGQHCLPVDSLIPSQPPSDPS